MNVVVRWSLYICIWNLWTRTVQVVDAMRQTVTNMLGTLPPQFFDIHVSTVKRTLCPHPMSSSYLLLCRVCKFFTCEL